MNRPRRSLLTCLALQFVLLLACVYGQESENPYGNPYGTATKPNSGGPPGTEPVPDDECSDTSKKNASVEFKIKLGTTTYQTNNNFIAEDWRRRNAPFAGYNPPSTDKAPFSSSLSNVWRGRLIRPVVLGLVSNEITDTLFTPAGLQLYGNNAGGAWVKRDESGALRQILTDQYLTDITLEGGVTKIRVHHRGSINGQDPATQLFSVPENTICYMEADISRPALTSPPNALGLDVVLSEYSSSTTTPKISGYRWVRSEAVVNQQPVITWTMTDHNGAPDPDTAHTSNVLASVDLGGGITQRTRTISMGGVVITKTRDKYRDLGDSTLPMLRIVEQIEAYETPDAMTTTYTYTDATGTGTAGLVGSVDENDVVRPNGIITVPAAGAAPNNLVGGRLQSLVRSDGYWEEYKYQYNAGTRIMLTEKWSPWKNSAASDKANSRHTTITLQENSRTVIEQIAGQVVSNEHETLTIGPDGTRVLRNVVKTGADTAPLITENAYYSDSVPEPEMGRIQYTKHPDGTLTRYTYSNASDFTDLGGSALKTITETGTADLSAGTRSETVTNRFEQTIKSDTYDIASGLLLSSFEVSKVSGAGRPLTIFYNNDPDDFEEFTYACCGVKTHRARDGTYTDYTKDVMGRPDITTVTLSKLNTDKIALRAKTTTRAYVYSTETVDGVVLPKTTVTQSVIAYETQLDENGVPKRDEEGKLLPPIQHPSASTTVSETIDNLRGQTVISRSPTSAASTGLDSATVTYDAATRTTTSTGADGITRESTSYADGQPHTRIGKVAGTPVTPLIVIDYETHNLNGGGIKTITQQSHGGNVLSSSSSYADLAGRTFRTESPGYDGATLGFLTGFDERGRAVSSTTTGFKGNTVLESSSLHTPATHRVLNLLGETVESWTDSNGDGECNDTVVEGVRDSCRKSVSDYVTENDTVCRRTRQWVRDDADSDILVSTSYRSVDGLYQKSVPLSGPVTVTTAEPPLDGNSSSETRTYLTANEFLTSSSITTLSVDGTSTSVTVNKDSAAATISTATRTSDLLGLTASQGDGRSPATTYSEFTASGTPLRVTRGDGTYTITIPDSAGRPLTQTTYQSDHTLIGTVQSSYYPNGQLAASWGTNTTPTYKIYDIMGRLTELRTYRSADLIFEPTASTPDYDSTTWDYEPATGLLRGKTDADGKEVSYTYSADGKRATRTSALGITTEYYYDGEGRLNLTDYPDTTPDASFAYDRLGRQTKISNRLATSVFTYDPATLAPDLETVTYDLNLDQTPELTRVIDRGQDDLGRPGGFQLLDGNSIENQAIYSYSSSNGRLSTVEGNSTGTFTYGYTANSNLIESVSKGAQGGSPELKTVNEWYPNRDALLTKTNSKVIGENMTGISSIEYIVNGLGQRTQATRTGESTTATIWHYDDLGQLESADSTVNTEDRAYQYDAIGNRKKSADSLNLPPTDNYEANSRNQYSVIPLAPATPAYDFDGNMISGPLPVAPTTNSTLVWDAENRLLATSDGNSTRGSYLYDAQSRRIAKTVGESTTLFVYDGFNCIAEYSGSTSVSPTLQKTYLWGLDLSGTLQGAGGVGGLLAVSEISNSQISNYYPTFDGNGNVSEYLNPDGSVAAHFEYDPFGNTVVNTDSSNQFNYRFSTKPIDSETGLYYYNYRYYDPLTGRWPSRDPIGEEGGMNLYGFVVNDAVDYVDVLGLKVPGSINDGLDKFADLEKRLKALCKPCCKCPLPGKSKDTDALAAIRIRRCEAEAKDLAYKVKREWSKNFDENAPKYGSFCGGLLCWNWAGIFNQSTNRLPHSTKAWSSKIEGGENDLYQHFWTTFNACGVQTNECKLEVDDGFLPGNNMIHDGGSLPGENWKKWRQETTDKFYQENQTKSPTPIVNQ